MLTNVKIHKYGDHVDTDTILPGQYLDLNTEEDLAPHCLEGLDRDFVQRVNVGDVIIAGRNFGTGSSREHAPMAIKGCGVSCVIGVSFARIFYRNAINIGLPIFECPELVAAAQDGDVLNLDIDAGIFTLNGIPYKADAFSPSVKDIITAGGLVPFVQQQLASQA